MNVMNREVTIFQNWTRALIRRLPMLAVLVVLAGVFFVVPEHAHAAQQGPGLQWEGPLDKFTSSLKGPVAFSISLLGIIVCGAMLVFGGEINEFVRRGIMLVMAVALVALATSLLSTLFGVGALV